MESEECDEGDHPGNRSRPSRHARGGAIRPSPASGSERADAEARKRARVKELLVLTKANSRSTVHRSAYLDYIGFKMFDADGNADA